MMEEHKIENALQVGLSKIQPSSDLLDRINREADQPERHGAASAPSLWSKLRLGPKLELAVACILLVGLVGIAAVRNLDSHKGSDSRGQNEDGQVGLAPPATSAVQLDLHITSASDSVSVDQPVDFTMIFRNGGTTEATLTAPCGHPFNLRVEDSGKQIDDWLRQTYGGPPGCPPGPDIAVAPGETYSTTLRLRFAAPGRFSVYAINLGAVSVSAGNVQSNPVTVFVRPAETSEAAQVLVQFAQLATQGEMQKAANLLAPNMRSVYQYNNDYVALRNTPRMEIVRLVEMTPDSRWRPDVGGRDQKVAEARVFAMDVRYKVLGLIDSDFKDGEVYHHKATVTKYTTDGPWLISEMSSAGN